jgi:molybdopterin adenylyltransferase
MDNIKVAILTVSDRAYNRERDDLSGPAILNYSHTQGWVVVDTKIVSDDPLQIENALLYFLQKTEVDLILTTGGTGFSPRDNTPEVTEKIIEKKVPGLTELMRAKGFLSTPNSMLSRAVAGISRNKLIINLPGSPKGAVESLEYMATLIPHAISLLQNQNIHG